MTFDEFKQRFEIFSKIDTPAKLAVCENQYHSYLQQKEDADHFEPLDEEGTSSWLANYDKSLHSILGFDKIVNDQILLLIQPSFEAECLLCIYRSESEYTLNVVSVEESYWRWYRDNSSAHVKTKFSQGKLNMTLGDKVFSLIERAIDQAKKPRSGYAVLDGTVYILSMVIDGERKNVIKHSPDENSKTGVIIKLLSRIIELTKDTSLTNIENELLILFSTCGLAQ